jgi:hypothetical protein
MTKDDCRQRVRPMCCSGRCRAHATSAPLRGPQASGDFFAGLLSDHPLQKADPRRSYIAPDLCAILSRSRGGTDGLTPLLSGAESQQGTTPRVLAGRRH